MNSTVTEIEPGASCCDAVEAAIITKVVDSKCAATNWFQSKLRGSIRGEKVLDADLEHGKADGGGA